MIKKKMTKRSFSIKQLVSGKGIILLKFEMQHKFENPKPPTVRLIQTGALSLTSFQHSGQFMIAIYTPN